MNGGSVQLRRFRNAIRDGLDVAKAADLAGITIDEAKLIVADDEKNPPAPECFTMLMGHNSGDTKMTDNVAGDELRLLIERIERLEEEKKGISDDIRDVYGEAKARGYDAKIMRECVKLRRMESQVRQERQALIETYGVQLGLF